MDWHKGEYNHIINLYRMVVAAHPQDIDAYENAGWLLWSMNRDDEALAFYQQGLRANPNKADMYEDIGQLYANRKKDYQTGIRYLEKAYALPGGNPMRGHALAHAYEHAGRNADALKVWTRLARNPNDGAARHNLARLKRKMNERPAGRG